MIKDELVPYLSSLVIANIFIKIRFFSLLKMYWSLLGRTGLLFKIIIFTGWVGKHIL